jgi:hypothetical protein
MCGITRYEAFRSLAWKYLYLKCIEELLPIIQEFGL